MPTSPLESPNDVDAVDASARADRNGPRREARRWHGFSCEWARDAKGEYSRSFQNVRQIYEEASVRRRSTIRSNWLANMITSAASIASVGT